MANNKARVMRRGRLGIGDRAASEPAFVTLPDRKRDLSPVGATESGLDLKPMAWRSNPIRTRVIQTRTHCRAGSLHVVRVATTLPSRREPIHAYSISISPRRWNGFFPAKSKIGAKARGCYRLQRVWALWRRQGTGRDRGNGKLRENSPPEMGSPHRMRGFYACNLIFAM